MSSLERLPQRATSGPPMVLDTLKTSREGSVLFADSALFLEGMRHPEAQRRTQAAMARGFQTREAELALGRIVGDLADDGSAAKRRSV